PSRVRTDGQPGARRTCQRGMASAFGPSNPQSSVSPCLCDEEPSEQSASPCLRSEKAAGMVLRMRLVGANHSPKIEGLAKLPGRVNYFVGSDPKKWHSGVPTYARVRERDVYPGIDLVFYGRAPADG